MRSTMSHLRTSLALATLVSATTLLAAVSCGPAREDCGQSNCSGCCAQDGTCLGVSKQGFTQCGKEGAQCRACLPDQVCSNGRCLRDPDAGSLPEDDAGQTSQDAGAPDSGVSCGQRDQPCCFGGCYLGLSCLGGVCLPPQGGDAGQPDSGTPDAGNPGTKAVGDACFGGGECATGLCQIVAFPDGYCTKSCAQNGDCPSGSVCGVSPADSTGQTKVCLKSCSPAGSAGGCRTGYVCEKKGTSLDGTAVCFPRCTSPTQCGTATRCDSRGFCCGASGYACCEGNSCDSGLSCGAGGYCQSSTPDAGAPRPVGDPCTATLACAGGICFTEQPAGSSGCSQGCWSGGYCSQDCGSAGCPSGSSCSPYFSGGVSRCLKNCSWDGGQGDCRSGYVCDRGMIPSSSQAICLYRCNANSDCPTNVCQSGFCCGNVGYRCCSGNQCPLGGTCGANGYCQ